MRRQYLPLHFHGESTDLSTSVLISQDAWHNRDVKCYGTGENVLPIIHMDDLVNVILYCAETLPEKRYFLAVDNAKHTLEDISKVNPYIFQSYYLISRP